MHHLGGQVALSDDAQITMVGLDAEGMDLRVGDALYRVPLVLGINVYALAALVVIVSALVSGAMIWRNLAHLDMVAVLKTKE